MFNAASSLLIEKAIIGGEWIDADGGATLDVTNPADGQTVGRVPNMGAAETERAIAAMKTETINAKEKVEFSCTCAKARFQSA